MNKNLWWCEIVFFSPHSLFKNLFKRYRRHRLQRHCGASCPELVFTYFYTCITSEGSVAPSHSFHRETSHLLKATPSSVFECKSKKTFFFFFWEHLIHSSNREQSGPRKSLICWLSAWSTTYILAVQKQKTPKKQKRSPSLLVTACSETCGRFCIEICTNVSSIQQQKNNKSIKFIHQLLEKVFNKTRSSFVLGKLCQVMEFPRVS